MIIVKKLKDNMTKIKHEFKCSVCGKVAKYNFQNWNHLYSIDRNGDFEEINDWEGDENEFYCEKCAKENNFI